MKANQMSYIAVATPPAPQPASSGFALEIGSVVLTVMGFLGAWAFHTITSDWREDALDLRARMGKIEAIQATSGEVFVRREDYIRASQAIDKKLDDMVNRQDRQFQILLDKLIHSKGNDLN